jgi:hypothetical protein
MDQFLSIIFFESRLNGARRALPRPDERRPERKPDERSVARWGLRHAIALLRP